MRVAGRSTAFTIHRSGTPHVMGNALQDQLLKAGLVSDKQLKKARKDKIKDERRAHAQADPPSSAPGAVDHRRLQQQKAARDRELNRVRQTEAEQKAALAQVRQLIESHRDSGAAGDRPYHFIVEGKVKRIYVSDEAGRRITAGRLAIASLDGSYALVPADVAAKIRARHAPSLVLWNDPDAPAPDKDEYAAYTVPDDLVW
jgi:uncharacterized protein